MPISCGGWEYVYVPTLENDPPGFFLVSQQGRTTHHILHRIAHIPKLADHLIYHHCTHFKHASSTDFTSPTINSCQE